MSIFYKHSLILGIFLVLPGCGRYICWVKDVFHQACKDPIDKELQCTFVRSVHIYDQLNTVAHFDALWLAEPVRDAYAAIYAERNGLSPERYEALLRRNYEENKHSISFYVLTAIPPNKRCGTLFGKQDALWNVFLSISYDTAFSDCDNTCETFRPIEIKSMCPAPEYMAFFGQTYTRFKEAYLITFNARDIEGNNLLLEGKEKTISLNFARPDKHVSLRWKILANGQVCCADPELLQYDIKG